MVHVHDVPILGIFTTAVAEGFARLPTKEDVQDAFQEADAGKKGKLNKDGVAEALRLLGKAERQVQKLVDLMDGEEIDKEGFTELVIPSALPWTWELGPVPIPNHEKVFDTPVLGNLLWTTNDLLALSFDSGLRSFRKSMYPPSELDLALKFKEADADKSGKLDPAELSPAMRAFYRRECEIKAAAEHLSNRNVSFYEFKVLMRGPKYSPSYLSYVPLVGAPLDKAVDRVVGDPIPEEDMRDAFEHIAGGKGKQLDKTGIADVLRELGKPEFTVHRMVDWMPQEEFNFDEFAQWYANPTARTWAVTAKGVPLPNPSKIHDVPLIGTATSLVQDVVTDAHDWTSGAAAHAMHSWEEDELEPAFQRFDEGKSGKLTRKQAACAMRSLGLKEWTIKQRLDGLERESLSFEDFRLLMNNRELPDATSV